MTETEETMVNIVKSAYARGLRSNNLESQPAAWMIGGLKILESGRDLTAKDIEKLNISQNNSASDPGASC